MTTPRKTRAPRKPSDFRMTYAVASTISIPLHTALLELQPRRSTAIRDALSTYAHKANNLKVSDAYRPPARFDQQVSISAVVKPEALRQKYESHAFTLGITMSELVLRCLCAYVGKGNKLLERPKNLPDHTP